MPPSEHRRFPRFHVDGVEATLESAVKLTSISRSGLTFESTVELVEGSFYTLLLDYEGHEARVIVDVKWVTPSSSEARKGSSLRF